MDLRVSWWPVAALLLALATCCDGYRYLLIFTTPSKSHMIIGEAVAKTLTAKGHEVVFTQAFPSNNTSPGLTELDFSGQVDGIKKIMQESGNTNVMQKRMTTTFIRMFADILAETALDNPALNKLINDPNERFDAVIVEWFFSNTMLGLAPLFNCPLILFSSNGIDADLSYLVDELPSPGVVPLMFNGLVAPLNLWERIQNTYQAIWEWSEYILHFNKKNAVSYEKRFREVAKRRGVEMPDFYDAIHNASLLFVNTHPSLSPAERYPPNVVEIGGFHVPDTPAPLSPELKKLLDESKHGVIYFSMGSALRGADMPPEIKKAFLETFKNLKQTVLWKMEEELPDLPRNVHTLKWAPQQSILAHPNTKIFISHGGMLSTTEAIHCGVPLIGIPIFGDQPINVARAERMGYAYRLDFETAGQNIGKAINAVLNDSKYTETVKRLSKVYHDRPIRHRDALVYWAEYVVRTGGNPHLKSVRVLIPWYQKYLLDIFGILLTILASILILLKCIYNKVFNKISVTHSNSKKNK